MTTDRARRREDVTARVLEIGRQHLAEHGAAGLSLRAVTRDLGMVSSAVYRYVANRDELLTLLLVDAYGAQADAVQAAVTSAADQRWPDRLLAASHAFRAWAVAEPSRYALLYGSPVPGYAAPPEVTIEPGTRVIGILLALVAEGVTRGDVPDRPAPHDPPEPLAGDLRVVGCRGRPGHPPGRAVAGVVGLGHRRRRHQPRGVSGSTAQTPSGTPGRPTTSRFGWSWTSCAAASTSPDLSRSQGQFAGSGACTTLTRRGAPDSATRTDRGAGGGERRAGSGGSGRQARGSPAKSKRVRRQRPAASRARWARTTASTSRVGNSSR